MQIALVRQCKAKLQQKKENNHKLRFLYYIMYLLLLNL